MQTYQFSVRARAVLFRSVCSALLRQTLADNVITLRADSERERPASRSHSVASVRHSSRDFALLFIAGCPNGNAKSQTRLVKRLKYSPDNCNETMCDNASDWGKGAEVMLRHLAALLAACTAIVGARESWAWGDEGHKVICEIAMRLVQPNTRAEIEHLIKIDTGFDRFSDSCTWPDHPRKRSEEHFVNLARDSGGLTSDTCPGAHGVRLVSYSEGRLLCCPRAARTMPPSSRP